MIIHSFHGEVEFPKEEKHKHKFKFALSCINEILNSNGIDVLSSSISLIENKLVYIEQALTVTNHDSVHVTLKIHDKEIYEEIGSTRGQIRHFSRNTYKQSLLVHESMWDTIPTITYEEIIKRVKLKKRLMTDLEPKITESRLKDIRSTLDVLFKRRWDITSDDDGTNIYIHYPQFIIENDDGEEHEILDLYVRYRFDKSWKIRKEICGFRSTYTQSEYYSNYAHSHLSGTPDRFGNFCLGSSTEVAMLLQEMYTEKWSVDRFEMLLQQFDSQVRWENRDDVYLSMDAISSYRSNHSSEIRSISLMNSYNLFKNKYDSFPIKHKEGQFNQIFTVDSRSKEFQDMVLQITDHTGKLNNKGKFIEKKSKTSLLIDWYKKSRRLRGNTYCFKFKGEEKRITIKRPVVSFVERKGLIPNPRVVSYIEKNLNKLLNKASDNGEQQQEIKKQYEAELEKESFRKKMSIRKEREERRIRESYCWNGKVSNSRT